MKTKKKTKKLAEKVEVASTATMTNPVIDVILDTPADAQPVVKIAPFDGDFGRVDINQLRDKVNEIIAFINK